MDESYPAERLNQALIGGYLKGVGQKNSSSMKQATPPLRKVARSYLVGYRQVLTDQSNSFVALSRHDEKRDPSAADRYSAVREKILQKAQQELIPSNRLTPRRALMAGQVDAYLGRAAAPQKILDQL
jgi:hypothetical protein